MKSPLYITKENALKAGKKKIKGKPYGATIRNDETYGNQPFYKTGGFMGINPDHKGYCTPMTKATCTPRRKALAKRLKPGGDLYKGKK